MTFTPHALAGAALGVATGNPYAGFVLGVISHHLLDMVPHFDQYTFRIESSRANYLGLGGEYVWHAFIPRDWLMLAIDVMLASFIFLGILWFLPPILWPAIFFSALGGLLPDIINSSKLWTERFTKDLAPLRIYHAFHTHFHFTVSPSLIWLGVATQVIVIILSVWYILSA